MVLGHLERRRIHKDIILVLARPGEIGMQQSERPWVVAEQDGALARQRLGLQRGELFEHRAVGKTHLRQVAPHQQRRHGREQQPDGANHRAVHERGRERLARAARRAPVDQQEVTAEVADTQRAQVEHREAGHAKPAVARAQLRVQGQPNAGRQQDPLHRLKRHGRQPDAGPAVIAKSRAPAQSDEKDRDQRSHGQQQRLLLREPEVGMERREGDFLKAQAGGQRAPKRHAGDIRLALDRREHKKEAEPGQAPQRGADQEAGIEETQPFAPDDSDAEQRQQGGHRPVAGHPQAVNKSGARHPRLALADAELEAGSAPHRRRATGRASRSDWQRARSKGPPSVRSPKSHPPRMLVAGRARRRPTPGAARRPESRAGRIRSSPVRVGPGSGYGAAGRPSAPAGPGSTPRTPSRTGSPPRESPPAAATATERSAPSTTARSAPVPRSNPRPWPPPGGC